MKNNTNIKSLLGLLTIIIIFHIGVITKMIPYKVIWGGQLQTDTDMYIFEASSIIINLLLIWVLLIKDRFIKSHLSPRITNIILWCFLVLLSINTIGNLFAKTNIEKSFSLLSFILALLIWRTLKNKTE